MLPVIPSGVALIVELPSTRGQAQRNRDALEMLAIKVVAEGQFTSVVKFRVVLSVYVPVAVNCSEFPVSTMFRGGNNSDFRTAALTVSPVEPLTPLNVALIVDVP